MPTFMKHIFFHDAPPPPLSPPPSSASRSTTETTSTSETTNRSLDYDDDDNDDTEGDACSSTQRRDDDENDTYWFFVNNVRKVPSPLSQHSPIYVSMSSSTTRLTFQKRIHGVVYELTKAYRKGYLSLKDVNQAAIFGDFHSTEIISWLGLVPDEMLHSCDLLSQILTIVLTRFRNELVSNIALDSVRTLTFVAPRIGRVWLRLEAEVFYTDIASNVFSLPHATLFACQRCDGLEKRNACSWFTIFLAKISYDMTITTLYDFHQSCGGYMHTMFHRAMDIGCPFLALTFSLFVHRDVVYGRCRVLYEAVQRRRRYVTMLNDTEYANVAAMQIMLAVRYDKRKFDLKACGRTNEDGLMPQELDLMVGMSFDCGFIKPDAYLEFVEKIFRRDSLTTRALYELLKIPGINYVISTNLELPFKRVLHSFVYGLTWRFLSDATMDRSD